MYLNQDHPGCDSGIEFVEKLNEAGVYCSMLIGGGCAHTGPVEAMPRTGPFFIRDSEYVPTPGYDHVSQIESFFVGNVKDFLEYDLRRDNE